MARTSPHSKMRRTETYHLKPSHFSAYEAAKHSVLFSIFFFFLLVGVLFVLFRVFVFLFILFLNENISSALINFGTEIAKSMKLIFFCGAVNPFFFPCLLHYKPLVSKVLITISDVTS